MTNLLNKLAPALTALFASALAVSAVPPQPRAGEPLVGLTSSQMQRFQEGRDFYSTPLSIAKGLGPAFNQPSCAACHEQPLGGWGASSVTHFGNLVGGNFNFLTALGGPVLQQQAISLGCKEILPSAAIANHVRVRVTPSVLAFGLVEAISDASIIALEDPNDANGDGISGRAHRVATLEDPAGPLRIGRFGWKAQIATVLSFSGDAARTEMGLTNSVVPTETAPNGNAALLADCDTVPEIEDQPNQFGVTFVAGVTAFQRYLGPPPQSPRSGMAGEAIFNAVGCVKCHTAQFLTPNDPALEGAIRNKAIRVYSDFLLHDMGALADGIPDGQATGVEMKTPPLWNLRTRPVLLHDGSASDGCFSSRVTQAITAHAGEAMASRNAFLALGATDRAALLAFLDSLGRNDYDTDSDGLITRLDFALIVRNSTDANVTADEAWAVADLNQNHLIDADEVTQLRDMLGVPVDCNQNGVADWTEIATGATDDLNGNGVPDECDQTECTARTKRVSGTGGAIPDLGGGPLTRTISAVAPSGNPAIQSIRVTLNIAHTWLSDLTITLRRGSDLAITLHPGCGTFHDINGRYLLTDTAWEGAPAGLVPICESALIDGGGAPESRFTFTPGTFRPTHGSASTGFQSMRGQSMGADWTLEITDSRSNDVGNLQSWSLDFRYVDSNPANCDGIGGADCAQLAANPELDCDGNGVIDTCESMSGDCDGDGVRDRCEIVAGDGQDCNSNGQLDSCDIASGIVADCNSNGVVDSCELANGDELDSDSDLVLDRCEQDFGDLNLDGEVNAPDLALLLGAWGTQGVGLGDFNGDGTVNAADLAILLSKWGAVPSWAQPTLSGVTPNAGPLSGGTAITLTGTNLDGATSLTVGGAAAANLVVVSATRLTAVTPAGSTGARDIVVTTPRGVATLAGGFNYQTAPPPTISSVSPDSGSTVGGTAITITGMNLTGTSSVTVGGVAATSVTVVSSTALTAVMPAGTAGAKTVSVTTPGGMANLTNAFTYISVNVPSWATLIEEMPDPAVVTNATLRNAIIQSGTAWRVRDNGTQIEMVLVPGGTFVMGCTASNAYACSPDETSTHSVTITNAFYMGRYEVTQAQWQARMGSNPSFFQGASYPDAAGRPVEQVGWNTIQGFLTATGMQLPTEAQWEYACRAGTTTAFHGFTGYLSGTNDDTLAGSIAWYSGNNGASGTPTHGTKPVGGKAANALGLHDMGGNVWEWCNDWYGAYSGAQTNPTGPATGTDRVVRGGGWGGSTDVMRSSNRYNDTPDNSYYSIGFRVARAPGPVPTISLVSPNTGNVAGGTAITITGTNLTGTSSVTIGGVAATSVSVVSSTTVTAVTSAGTAGAKTVSVTTPGGTANLTNAFTYFSVNVPSWATLIEAMPDPAVVINADLRNAIIASGFAWRIRDNSSNIEMLLVPPGTFQMGCIMAPDIFGCGAVELPVHTVTLTNAYYLGRYEVTQAQWQAKMGSNPSYFAGQSDSPSRPVEQVSWNTIQNFLSATGLRLPTEAEWEFACRAGTTTPFHSGPGFPNGTTSYNLAGTIAWSGANSGSVTHAVGGKATNALGMHDMLGNVWEWQSDWYGAYSSSAQTNPTGPGSGLVHVLRGGSFGSFASDVRSSKRDNNHPDNADGDEGFRVARAFTEPTISSVSPNSGSTEGGTAITITGMNLTGTSSVTIGGAAATSVSVVNSTTVTAVTPAGTAGAKTVSITTPLGTVNLTNAFFSVNVPSWATLIEEMPDPAVVTNATLRNAIIQSGTAWRVRDNGTQIEMVLMPGGTFVMGCTASNAYPCSPDETSTHSVTITNAFYMGRYEVTQAQWQARMGSNPSFFQGASYPDAASRPVEQVGWNTIQGFLTATGMQLPTEAQWEYASRAGTTTAFHGFTGYLSGTNDDTLVGNIAWYSGNNGASGTPTHGTKPVGGKAANALGLHDMGGNVWEWCSDWYGGYSAGAQTNPTGPATGTDRVVRGGGWGGSTDVVRSSNRYDDTPGSAYYSIGFRVARATGPTISLVSPNTGNVAGGTAITITGTNLTGTSSVTIGGVAATSVSVVSSTAVTAVMPAGTAGAKTVSATTPSGTASLTNGFTYIAGPTVGSVTPNSGSTTGGTSITITGTGFSGATSVAIGGVAATSVVVVSATTISANAPVLAAGVYGVSVTTPFGTGSLSNAYTAVVYPPAPTISSVAPNVGPTAGGTAITITGNNFTGATSVTVGGVGAWNLVVVSTTSLTATTPSGTAGARSIVVTSPWGQGTLTNGFTYVAQPTISSFSPNVGPTSGGTAITITGTNLTGTSSVSIGGAATSVSVVSATTVTAVTPGGPSFQTVTVGLNTPGGTASLYGFSYQFSPTISSVLPNVGPTSGGTAITITGADLTNTSSVTVGGNAATSVVVVNATKVTAVTPSGGEGARNVSLNGTLTANGAFTYQAYATPTIWSVSPNTGNVAGGTAIMITGTNLTGTSSVTIGGVAATSVSVVSSTTVTAVAPAGIAGTKSVSITTPGGTADLTNGFTYTGVWYTVLEQNPNPAVVTDASLRSAITATGYPWRVRDNGTQIEMVLVPGGTFVMGCTASNAYACSADENPTHSVTITNAFYMGRYEVTQAQWQARMGSNPSAFQGASYPDAGCRPVEKVSWNMIQGFLTATGMQLPTEAQWEYACRAGTTTAYHGFTGYLSGTNDDTLAGNIAWYGANSGNQTHAAGGKAANTLGLHDMGGNVHEWCNDRYGAYSAAAQTNPTGPPAGPGGGTFRVLRGGAWGWSAHYVRSSSRFSYGSFAYNDVGFRVARAPS